MEVDESPPNSPVKRGREQFERDSDGEMNIGQTPSNSSSPPKENLAKLVHVNTHGKSNSRRENTLTCYLAPHTNGWTFDSYAAYEHHYEQWHVNQCDECKKILPSLRLLELHVAECHDSLFAARRARGEKVYACFVEGCNKICTASNRRKMHLIDFHHFSTDYKFEVVHRGIDGTGSLIHMPRPRKRYVQRGIRSSSAGSGQSFAPGPSSEAVSTPESSSMNAASPVEMEANSQGEALGRSNATTLPTRLHLFFSDEEP